MRCQRYFYDNFTDYVHIYRTIITDSNASLNVIIEITIINRTEFRIKANSINCVIFTSVIFCHQNRILRVLYLTKQLLRKLPSPIENERNLVPRQTVACCVKSTSNWTNAHRDGQSGPGPGEIGNKNDWSRSCLNVHEQEFL